MTVPKDIFGFHNWSEILLQCIAARGAGKHPAVSWTAPTANDLAPKVNRAEVETPGCYRPGPE